MKMKREDGGYAFPDVGLFAYREKTTNPHQWVIVAYKDYHEEEGWAVYASSLDHVKRFVEYVGPPS